MVASSATRGAERMLETALREALQTLRQHRGRAALTLFGIVWGTASVIFLTGWGDGVRLMLERGFFKTGRNMAAVWAGRIGEEFTPAVDRRYLWFEQADLEAVRARAKLSDVVGGEYWTWGAATFGGRSRHVDLRGLDPEAVEIRGTQLAAGRAIQQTDVDHRRRVVVLGDEVRRTLLGTQGGVGDWIRLDGKPFQVIDKQVWGPISTIQTLFPPWWSQGQPIVTDILFRLRDRHQLEDAKREVRGILAERIGVSPTDDEAISIYSSIEMLNRFPLDEQQVFLFVLATATLAVGGIGVLSMMLDAVHERRLEIGLRLAVGARPRDVLWHFFLETLVVTGIGGILGVLLGVAGAAALGAMQVPDLVPVPILRASLVIVAFLVMSAVGVLAGVVPAWRAARIDPAITLRAE
jgi:putative ABC transport system permease protein